MRYSPPQPELFDHAISTVVQACKTVFSDNLECIILKGSAIKGDFIRDYSDFDFHVFLKPKAMDGKRNPKIKEAIMFQKLIGKVNAHDFGASQFQIFFLNSMEYPKDWIPPMKGTYKILLGKKPSFKELDDSMYLKHAQRSLSNILLDKQRLIERFVDKHNSQVPTLVRLVGQYLKGHIYSLAIFITSRPNNVLNLKLDELISLVEKEVGYNGYVSKFYEYIDNWSIIQDKCDYAQEAFKAGIEALKEINDWYSQQMLK